MNPHEPVTAQTKVFVPFKTDQEKIEASERSIAYCQEIIRQERTKIAQIRFKSGMGYTEGYEV